MDSKALSATGWIFGAECMAKAIVPITNMILARILAPEAFGIIVTINMVISFAEMITSAGFQKYLIQADFESEQMLNQAATVAFWSNLLVSLGALAIIAVFRDHIAVFVGSEGYGAGIAIASIALPITSLTSITEGLYKRKLEYRVLFFARIVVCATPFFVTIPLALLGLDYWAMVIGTLLGQLFKAIIYVIHCSNWRPTLFFKLEMLRKMLSFGVWTLIEAIISWFINWIDVFIVGNLMNAYYTGLYKTAQSMVSSVLSIMSATTQPVLFSLLSRCKSNFDEFKELYYQYIQYAAIILIPLGVGIFLYSDTVTLILLGEQWIEASRFIGVWGLCSAIVCLFGEHSREAYRALGKPQIGVAVQGLHLLFIAPICWIGATRGFHTLTNVRAFAHLEVLILHAVAIRAAMKLSFLQWIKSSIIPLIGSVVMMGISFVLKTGMKNSIMSCLVQIGICVVTYFVTVCLFQSYRNIVMTFIHAATRGVLKKRRSQQ